MSVTSTGAPASTAAATAEILQVGTSLVEKARTVRAVALLVMEAAILLVVGLWLLIGMVAHAKATGWSLSGLLTMLHDQWRGAIILGVLVFYLTLREGLDQLKLKTIKAPGLEFEVRADPLKPTQEKTT